MGIKLQILSDLHLEFGAVELKSTESDVAVLAGDIAPGTAGLQVAKNMFGKKPVVYVAGNHEYYGQSLPQLTEDLKKEARGGNVHFLDNDEVVLAGVRFLGCTLWTDFELFGADRREDSITIAGFSMNDYRVVNDSNTGGKLRPIVTRGLHQRSRAFLEDALAKHFDGPTVVVTHHAPSMQSIDPLFHDDPVSAAYASNMEALMGKDKVKLWIHGHTHRSTQYEVNGTLVLSNQRGYPDQGTTGFKSGLVIEV